jgi:hypothetical protein
VQSAPGAGEPAKVFPMNRLFRTPNGESLTIKDADALTCERGSLELLYDAVLEKTNRAIPTDAGVKQTKMAALKAIQEELTSVSLEDVLELKTLVEIDEEAVDGFEETVAETVEQSLNRVAKWRAGMAEGSSEGAVA